MDTTMASRAALVTGSSGIGRATALRLRTAGCVSRRT
jgi:NAD(P)-dependent dehydrogenase (short-subunit alcohol dehydrogenase family)